MTFHEYKKKEEAPLQTKQVVSVGKDRLPGEKTKRPMDNLKLTRVVLKHQSRPSDTVNSAGHLCLSRPEIRRMQDVL